MFLNRFHRYLFWRNPRPHIPRQLINPYDLRKANEDERLLMLAGYARSPDAARLLMKKRGIQSAAEMFRLYPKKRPNFLKRRVINLIRWAEGHYRGRAFKRGKVSSEIAVQYIFEKGKE